MAMAPAHTRTCFTRRRLDEYTIGLVMRWFSFDEPRMIEQTSHLEVDYEMSEPSLICGRAWVKVGVAARQLGAGRDRRHDLNSASTVVGRA
jgi:hypothetical protein